MPWIILGIGWWRLWRGVGASGISGVWRRGPSGRKATSPFPDMSPWAMIAGAVSGWWCGRRAHVWRLYPCRLWVKDVSMAAFNLAYRAIVWSWIG